MAPDLRGVRFTEKHAHPTQKNSESAGKANPRLMNYFAAA
jgi:hypothetical protein